MLGRTISLVVILFIILVPFLVEAAQDGYSVLQMAVGEMGAGIYGENAPVFSTPLLIGMYIRAFLSLIGIFLVIIMVYAGYLWLTAGGNPDTVTKARRWISNGIVGMIVTLAAFAITDYVMGMLVNSYMHGLKEVQSQQ